MTNLSQPVDYVGSLTQSAATSLQHKRDQWLAKLSATDRSLLDQIESVGVQAPPLSHTFEKGGVTFSGSAPEAWQSQLQQALQLLMPWKKGPFSLPGVDIDAEWRSDIKWDRVKDRAAFSAKVVADIGSHNGYFMFAASHLKPSLMIGLEPAVRPVAQFNLLQQLGRVPHIYTEPVGVEDIDQLYSDFFDTVLCMGILYHQTDPIQTLRKIHKSLRRRGELIVDCQGIAGPEPHALVPEGRYCGATGIWWLPTTTALLSWVRRAGFREAEIFFSEPLSTLEQRATAWAPIKSLADFLSPDDQTKTVEGYPAPWRHYLWAKR